MRPRDRLDVVIEALSPTGQGLVHHDGVAVQVADGTPGDRLSVEIVHVSPHRATAWAETRTVETRGPAFRDPVCPHAWPVRGRCGGCPLQHLDAPAQLHVKHLAVREALGELWPDDVAIEASPVELGYRARASFIVTRSGTGELTLGSYAPRSHDVVPMHGCLSARPAVTRVADAMADALAGLRIPVHPENPGLRYVTVRAGTGHDVVVDLVVNAPASWLGEAARLLMTLPGVVGVSFSINDSGGNALRVSSSHLLCGVATVEERFGDVSVHASADAFTQLNAYVATAMYQRAASWVGSASVVWDLYCGLGAFGRTVAAATGAFALRGAESLYGVETPAPDGPAAPLDTQVEALDLERSVPTDWPSPSVVLVNPPRRGLSEGVRALLASVRAPVVYMSCSPASFARDVRTLAASGARLSRLTAFDMLPQTLHVELLGLLTFGPDCR